MKRLGKPGRRTTTCSERGNCSHSRWECGRAGITYYHPLLEFSHKMKYLIQKSYCVCNPVEHGKNIGIQCRIIKHICLKICAY